MPRLFLAAAALAGGLAAPALAQDDAESPTPTPEIDESTPTTLTVIPDEVIRGEVAPTITVPAIAVGTVTLEPGPGAEGTVSVGAVMEAAVTSGFLGELLTGRPYTIFMPTTAALAAVPEDALAEVTGDPAALSEVIQGYVVEGTFDTDAALALAREGGGEATVTSLTGTPIVLAAEGDDLTVNGALKSTLIPSAQNAQLKSLLETGLTLFTEHQKHAEHLASAMK